MLLNDCTIGNKNLKRRRKIPLYTSNLNLKDHEKNVVHTDKRVLIVRREKKTSTVGNARNMDTQLKNVSARTEKTARIARKMVTRLKNVISRRSV